MKRQPFLLAALAAIVSFLLGLVAAGTRPVGGAATAALGTPPADPKPLTVSVMRDPPAAVAGVGVDFSVVAARLNGAVVNIDAASRGTDRPTLSRRSPRDPSDD